MAAKKAGAGRNFFTLIGVLIFAALAGFLIYTYTPIFKTSKPGGDSQSGTHKIDKDALIATLEKKVRAIPAADAAANLDGYRRLLKLDIEGNKQADHSYIFADKKLNKNIGFVTSAAWSPVCKRNIALGSVRTPHGVVGSHVWVEIYYQREMHWSRVVARAEVVDKPFWFPERRGLTPPGFV